MTINDKINIYYSSLKKDCNYKEVEPFKEELYLLVDYIHDKVLSTKDEIEVDSTCILILDKLIDVLIKVNDNGYTNRIKDFIYFIHNLVLDTTVLADFFNLSFFPNDCFIKNNDEREKEYYYIIEIILSYEPYYETMRNNDLLLYKYISLYLEYIFANKKDYNYFAPNIILYCIKNQIDEKEYIEMISYSYENYNEYIDYIDTNDDYSHQYELSNKVLKKIVSRNNNNSIR